MCCTKSKGEQNFGITARTNKHGFVASTRSFRYTQGEGETVATSIY